MLLKSKIRKKNLRILSNLICWPIPNTKTQKKKSIKNYLSPLKTKKPEHLFSCPSQQKFQITFQALMLEFWFWRAPEVNLRTGSWIMRCFSREITKCSSYFWHRIVWRHFCVWQLVWWKIIFIKMVKTLFDIWIPGI